MAGFRMDVHPVDVTERAATRTPLPTFQGIVAVAAWTVDVWVTRPRRRLRRSSHDQRGSRQSAQPGVGVIGVVALMP